MEDASFAGHHSDALGMKRRRGMRMAFLLVGLCAGLAGLANGYERFSPMLKGITEKLPLPIVESPGMMATDQAFDPVVMMAGLPLPQGMGTTPQSKKPDPGVVIFGPGGNGPEVDLTRMRAKAQDQIERPAVKEDTVVLVRDSEDINHR